MTPIPFGAFRSIPLIFYLYGILTMDRNNVYRDINENPNIYPASRGYVQTQPFASQKQFQDTALLQEQQRQQSFYSTLGPRNLSNTTYATVPSGSRAAREERSRNPPATTTYQTQMYNNAGLEGDDSDGSTVMQTQESDSIFSHMAYPQVYTPQEFLQLPQKNLINDPDPSYLAIDSEDRDRTKYPNPNVFTIPLVSSDTNGYNLNIPGKRYKNITTIDLVSAVVPNTANILDEIYLILHIDELEDNTYDASNPSLSRGFAKLYFTEVTGTTKWLRLDRDMSDPLHKIYYPKPKASLDRITIRILHRDGTPFNFGTDNTLPTPVNPDLQNTWTFRITQKIVNVADAVGQRNI